MKKFLSLALVMTMCVGTLTACGGDKDPATSGSTSGSSSEVVENTDGSNSTGDTSIDVDIPEDAVRVPSANARLAYIIDQARSTEDAEAFPVQSDNAAGALEFIGLSEDMMDEYAVAFSMMNVHAYAVTVTKPAEGKEDAVKIALDAFKQQKMTEFKNYLPDQLVIAEDAVVFTEGDYVGLVMCNDADAVADKIVEGLKGIDEIYIDESMVEDTTDDTNVTEDVDVATNPGTDGNPEDPGDEGMVDEPAETIEDNAEGTTSTEGTGVATNEDNVEVPSSDATSNLEVVE